LGLSETTVQVDFNIDEKPSIWKKIKTCGLASDKAQRKVSILSIRVPASRID
jgi:hypothetical protein